MRISDGLSFQQDTRTGSLTPLDSVSSMYVDIGGCRWSCNHYGARFWYGLGFRFIILDWEHFFGGSGYREYFTWGLFHLGRL
nr:hypothetical protein [Tanacetum cinerariifolium]